MQDSLHRADRLRRVMGRAPENVLNALLCGPLVCLRLVVEVAKQLQRQEDEQSDRRGDVQVVPYRCQVPCALVKELLDFQDKEVLAEERENCDEDVVQIDIDPFKADIVEPVHVGEVSGHENKVRHH